MSAIYYFMEKSKIYTKTGDQGSTSLVGGVRVSKSHIRLEAYGTIDELNAFLGMLVCEVGDADIKSQLQYVQHKLFTVGGYLATDQSQTKLHQANILPDESVDCLEKAIDQMDAGLPALKGFILPGGARSSALCHVCRTICRRAERRILALEEAGICQLDVNVKRFINRLSDYLFVLARKLNYLTEIEEFYWDKSCK